MKKEKIITFFNASGANETTTIKNMSRFLTLNKFYSKRKNRLSLKKD